MQIEVAILPQETTNLSSRVILAIDVIRATTSLCTLFERGARRVTLAVDVAAARASAAAQPQAILLGESGGLAPTGFAYGNSPVELAEVDFNDRELIFTTSNGTNALRVASGGRAVLAACMRNGTAAVRAAYTLAHELGADIGIVCAGRARCTRVGQDDVICAGYLVQRLIEANGGRLAPWQPDADFADLLPTRRLEGGLDLDDSAKLALRLYCSVVSEPGTPRAAEIAGAFRESASGQGLALLGLAHDVDYCAQIDTSRRVPRLAGEAGPSGGGLAMICEAVAE